MPSPITPDVVYELTTVSEPAVSPDGRRLAFVRSKVDRATMESPSQIMMLDLPDGEPTPFARGSAPKFSPDGQTLAFLRPDERERRQLWLIPTTGGEARQLTELPGGVSEYAWSPDSGAVVGVSDVDPDRPPDSHDTKLDPRVRVVRRVRYRGDTIGWRGDAHRHLFIVAVEGGEPRQLTDGDWDDSTPAWSPDGNRIAFISGRREDRDFVAHNEVYVVSTQGGEPSCWSQGLSSAGAVTWSPDGARLAVVGSDDDALGAAWQGWLFVLGPGQPPMKLTSDSLKPVASFAPIVPAPELRWTADGRIIFLADSRGQSYLFEVPAAGGEVHAVAGGGEQIAAVTVDGRTEKAVVAGSCPTSPADLYMVGIADDSRRQLTEHNRGYFQEHPAARMEKFVLPRGEIGVECRLLFPPDFDESRKYPLVVDIHGGPHGAFYDAFVPIQQVLATAGYLVLCPNPRGSSSYGAEFVKAVLEDWGGEDYLDIMAAVEEVCRRPYVDPSRLGVHGYSYGGYMSSWIVGHDDRFGAAVVGAPCIDLPSMYGTSDIGVSFGEREWGGTRVDAERAFSERSPLTYAAHVDTPVLLLHGEADVRCPIEQSEQYFVTLKRLGKEVEFVRFPGCSHLFLRSGHPRMREEYLGRTLAWFDRHLGHPSRQMAEVTASDQPGGGTSASGGDASA